MMPWDLRSDIAWAVADARKPGFFKDDPRAEGSGSFIPVSAIAVRRLFRNRGAVTKSPLIKSALGT
jgi:hypothetical protein